MIGMENIDEYGVLMGVDDSYKTWCPPNERSDVSIAS